MSLGHGHAELRATIEEVVYRASFLLDDRQFGTWLDTTAPDFVYRIVAYSPELKKDMTWLEHDRSGMAALIELLPKHHTNGANWLRQVVVGNVRSQADDTLEVTSSLSIFHTLLDVGDAHIEGGSSRLFAVGRYQDTYRQAGGSWLLSERTVRLQTRQLGVGSHLFP
jgi:methanesulfonate monooxygenase subunit beta